MLTLKQFAAITIFEKTYATSITKKTALNEKSQATEDQH